MTNPAQLFSLPFEDGVLIFATIVSVFLVVPLVFERFKVPSIIGLIIAGAVVGPNGTGLLARSEVFALLGDVGLLYLMFTAGLEMDLNGFKENRRRSLGFGALTFLLPQGLGMLMALYLLGYAPITAVLLASLFASHTLLAYPIASRLGITRESAVTTSVSGTIITDTAALLVLAVVAAASQGDLDVGFWARLVPSVVGYALLVTFGLPRLGRWFFKRVRGGGVAEYTFILAAVYVCSFAAELVGLEPIIGAFLAGLALNRLIPRKGPLMIRIEFIGNAIFIPFFLVATGMLVDMQLLVSDQSAWLVAGSMVVTVTVAKFLAAWAARYLFGLNNTEAMVIFGLTVPQAAATLAAVFVGLELDIFDPSVLNGTILMILGTCLIGPFTVQYYGRKLALAAEQEDYRPSHAPQRVLVPLANPDTADALVDIAVMIRDRDAAEDIFPLSVVPEASDTSARVAQAERMLAHAVVHAAESEVNANPLTRVAQNPASGIVGTATERRITDIVIGWDGRSARRRVFGRVIDLMLNQSDQQVLVCKLNHALNTSERIVAIAPPLIDYSPGFYGAVRTLKQLAAQLGVSLQVMAVQGDTDRIKMRFDEVNIRVETRFVGVTGWRALQNTLQEDLSEDDLVMLLSSRPGTVAYTGMLERLPTDLARMAASFIVLYPSEQELRQEARGDEDLPSYLMAEHILTDLRVGSYEEAIYALLAAAFPENARRRRQIARSFIDDEGEFATEVLPGVLVPHARVRGIRSSMVLLGIHQEGFKHDQARQPVRVVALLLSPTDHPPQEHLSLLSKLAQRFGRVGRLEQLLKARDADEVKNWFRGLELQP